MKNTTTTFFISLLFLTLTTLTNAQNKTNLAIVFIGNSITQGKGGDKGLPPPTHAVNFLKEQKEVGDLSFVNVGRSGSTTVDWLPGSRQTGSRQTGSRQTGSRQTGSRQTGSRQTNGGKLFVLATKAADSLYAQKDHQLLFSMKLGTNDSAIEGPNGSPVSKEQYKKNMQTIISELLIRYPGSKVIIHHPIWYSENTYNSSKYLKEGLERMKSYIPEIDELVSEYKKSEPGRVFKGDTKAFKYFKKHAVRLFKPENGQAGTFYLHPNEEGVGVLGKYWGKAIGKVDFDK
ncbi:GDSL-type esterase/lipase family protein [Dyadobacter sp. NIV53]|uniref:GDSL-type esterase/lipase family protein n=1 Tax=Dyadobacter sp. NIV53 TaxID=2861765 RepID=UPI001C87D06E|nr:GDSL-type esterase/lipase family protein [Dyadobacter sp. NIV53]